MLPNTDDNSFSQPLTSLQHIFVISSDPTLISKQIFISSIPSYANCVVTHFMGFVKLIYVHRRTTGENGRERETEGKRERKKRERESETGKNKLKSIFKLNYTHSVSCNVIFPFDSTKKICLSWLLFWYRKYMVHDCFVGFLLWLWNCKCMSCNLKPYEILITLFSSTIELSHNMKIAVLHAVIVTFQIEHHIFEVFKCCPTWANMLKML